MERLFSRLELIGARVGVNRITGAGVYRERTSLGGINKEEDFLDLNVARLIGELAGLIRKYRGRFILSRDCQGGNFDVDYMKAALKGHGWSDDKIMQLVIEFEFASDLLKFCSGNLKMDFSEKKSPARHYNYN